MIERLNNLYPEHIKSRYKVEIEGRSPYDIIMEIGKKRGTILSGGEVDFSRISSIIIDEFRKGKIGRITLERPTDF